MRHLQIIALAWVALAGVAAADDNAALEWNGLALQAVRAARASPPVVARALAIVHTAMYDAWALYDERAAPTRLSQQLRPPSGESTPGNQAEAVSVAACRALADLFPAQRAVFEAALAAQGYDPADLTVDPASPTGIGNLAAAAVLVSRRHDGANQLGDLSPSGIPYADYTGYQPVNTVDELVDPNRWQPLAQSSGAPQTFVTPQWPLVVPFALQSPSQFRPPPPPLYPHGHYRKQANEVLHMSAKLTDTDKSIAWYWADGPGTETPPGHWCLLAQAVSVRDRHSLDEDVRMFFVLANALLDASIAAWDCKVAFDSVRPVSALRFLFAGRPVLAWGGPGIGTVKMNGESWIAYLPTPPFGEYVSGHSTFSAASAEVLRLFTGSDSFGGTATIEAGTVGIEPGLVPAQSVVLTWPTFSSAAEQAGLSRRLGGIHFEPADTEGRRMGRQIGALAWARALAYFAGRVPEPQ